MAAAYSLEHLGNEGAQFAMAMLLRCLKVGESFITYGAIRDELQLRLNIDSIFPIHIGHVAGTLMDRIIEEDQKAPLINALITHPNGMPGRGVGNYFAKRYKKPNLSDWDNISMDVRRQIVDGEREKVLLYKGWGKINKSLFGENALSILRKPSGSEVDGYSKDGRNDGGTAESDQHKRLKAWVVRNPQSIGLKGVFKVGDPESGLLSGDTIDVLFSHGNEYIVVEVKSCRSNDDDFHRGIYQCVKYREVKLAENAPNNANVRAVLVTERELSAELKARAALLGVNTKVVIVNKNSRSA